MSNTALADPFSDIGASQPDSSPPSSPKQADPFGDIAPAKAAQSADPFGDIAAPKSPSGITLPSFYPAIQQSAKRLGIDPEHLWRVMHFESGGNPSNVNPQSGATGLIQFMPSTAKGLGTSTDALKGMSVEQQLPYVEKYLQGNGVKPGMSFPDLYASVLWPKAVGQPNDYVLFKKGTAAYAENAGLDTGHKGYVTKLDAARAAWGHSDNPIALQPWEKDQNTPVLPIKNVQTGQVTTPATSQAQGVTPASHDDAVAANLSQLPFNIQDFLNAKRAGQTSISPKGGFQSPEQQISIQDAASQIAKAMGYPLKVITDAKGEPLLKADNSFNFDYPDKQSFLDPKSPQFKALQKLANRAGYTPETQENQDREGLAGQSPMVKAVIANAGGAKAVASMSPTEYAARGISAGLQPSTYMDVASGHAVPESQKSEPEKVVDTIGNLAGYLLGGVASTGVGAAEGAATLGKTLASTAAKFFGAQAAFQAPATLARAMQLQREQGLQPLDAGKQAITEAGQGLVQTLNPATLFNPNASPSEKINAGVMQAMLALGLGGSVLGKAGEINQFSQIKTPEPEPFRIEGVERPQTAESAPFRIQPNEVQSLADFTRKPPEPEPAPTSSTVKTNQFISGRTVDPDAVNRYVSDYAEHPDQLPPISTVDHGNGIHTVLDGTQRVEAAKQLETDIRAAHITLQEYQNLKAQGFNDQEIAYAVQQRAGNPDEAEWLAGQHGPQMEAQGQKAFESLSGKGLVQSTSQTLPNELGTQSDIDSQATLPMGKSDTTQPSVLDQASKSELKEPVPTQGVVLPGSDLPKPSPEFTPIEPKAQALFDDIAPTQKELPTAEGRVPNPGAGENNPSPRSTQETPPISSDQSNVIGIRKSISDAEARARNVPLHDQQPYTTPKMAHEAGLDAYNRSGLENTVRLAKEVSAKPRQLTTDEVGQFNAAHRDLINQENKVNAHMNTLDPKSPEYAVESANLRHLLDQHEALQDGIRKGRRENSAGLASFKMMSNLDDGTYAGARALAEKIKGEPLTAKEDAQIRAVQEKQNVASDRVANRRSLESGKQEANERSLAEKRFEVEKRNADRDIIRSTIRTRKSAAIDRIKNGLTETGSRLNANPLPSPELLGGIKDLAVAVIHEGAINLAEAYDKVNLALKEHGIPEVSMRVFNQALSGLYDAGQARTPTEAEARVRELKAQAALLTKINDTISGEKTQGRVIKPPSETVQGLRKSYQDLQRLMGTNPQPDPVKTLNRAIEKALDVLENGREAKPEKLPDTPEVAGLRQKLKGIQDQIKAKEKADPEQAKLKSLADSTQKKLDQLEGKYRNLKKPVLRSDDIDAAKAKLSDATRQLNADDRIAELQRQIREKDFPVSSKTKPSVSPELQKLMNEETHLKAQRAQVIESMKTPSALDVAMKLRRQSLLSGTAIFPKMAATNASYMAMLPLEDMIGEVIGKVRPGLAAKAPTEASFNAKAYAAGTIDFLKAFADGDLKQKFKTSIGKLDAAAYDRGDVGAKHLHEPPSALNFFNRLHGALHSTVQRYAYTVEATKLTSLLAKQGVDVQDPEVVNQIARQAYSKSLEASLMNDNQLNSMISGTLSGWERNGTLGKASAAVGRYEIPFSKVATNVVGRGLEYKLGLPHAIIADLFSKGNYTPEQAAQIMRSYKRGAIYPALLGAGVYAYLNGNLTGPGYYDPIAHGKNPDGQKNEDMRLFGTRIPIGASETILPQVMKFAITLGQAMKHHIGSGETAARVINDGYEQIPGVTPIRNVMDATAKKSGLAALLGNQIGSNIPSLLQDVARAQDSTPKNPDSNLLLQLLDRKVQKRDSSDFKGPILQGIPIARETLKKKP